MYKTYLRSKASLAAARTAIAILMQAVIAISVSATANAKELPAVKPVMDCAALTGMVLNSPDIIGKVESATVKPEEPAPPAFIAKYVTRIKPRPYCEVKGYVVPQVHFEIHLPTENWTQRLVFTGCGGFCGQISIWGVMGSDGCSIALNGEFATVTSDLGHRSEMLRMDAVWGADKQLREDFGFRGVHVSTVAAKEIVARYYGQPQAFAYFSGCSDGGREAMVSVQRYPEDFNGVVAGAPVVKEVANNTVYHAWGVQKLIRADGSKVFDEEAINTLHNGALAACDTMDGDPKDGVIPNPPECHFDPSALACRGGAGGAKCLTPEQVEAAKELYKGPHDAAGHDLYYGYDVGSELAWVREAEGDSKWGPGSFSGFLASNPPDRKVEFKNLAFTQEAFKKYNVFADVLNAENTDLRPLHKAGAKLIIWQGWGDVAVAPGAIIDYYKTLRKTVGPQTDDFVRFYVVPGVSHCAGGEGPDKLELVKSIVAWVEDGQAPGPLTAVRRDDEGKVTASRVIQPYK
jgi:Tannase and feruloyl esterase